MIRSIVGVAIAVCCTLTLSAQPRANVNLKLMQPAGGQRMVRVMAAVQDTSLGFTQVEGGYHQKALLTYRVNKDNQLLAEQRIELLGPTVAARDTLREELSYLMDQFSILLEPGEYDIEVTVEDAAKPSTAAFVSSKTLQLDQKDMTPLQSDIVFYSAVAQAQNRDSRFLQGDFELTPRASTNAFVGVDSLQFYWEVYNAKSIVGEPYFTEISVMASGNQQPVSGHQYRLKPELPSGLSVRVFDIDISDLPSQSYFLTLTLKTNAGKVVGRKQQKFFVYNPRVQQLENNEQAMFDVVYGYSETQLDSFIPTMSYLMNKQQKLTAKGLETYKEKKAFFYHFWQRLKAKPDNPPGLEWQNYYSGVKYANQTFESQMREGWRTDRGRVMLMYGPPSNVQTFFDVGNYIIWEYDNLQGQNGVIFIFRANDRSSDIYLLVHSTMRGEIYDPNVAAELESMLEDGDTGNLGRSPLIMPSTTGATRHRD